MKTTSAVMFLLLVLCYTSSTRGQTLEWTRQLGSSSEERSYSVSADGLGSVYISGYTLGSLDGINAGSSDAFVAKYDAGGALEWTRQLGTSNSEGSSDVSADGLGNVYISGSTVSLGGPNAGEEDAFISKYDSSGTLEWTRQLGTSSDWDWDSGVSADGLGNVYISGSTRGSLGGPHAGGAWDAFVAKYDAGGVLEWTRQLGTSNADFGSGVSADGLGNVYISGNTYGSLGGPHAGDEDSFISKYDASGSLQWTRQLGSSRQERSRGVSADGLGNVYISGMIDGFDSLHDAFISKYDASGSLQWTRQLGHGSDTGWTQHRVSADGLGSVYFSGWTDGADRDAFISKYDGSGTLQWTEQLGTSEGDRSRSNGVSADGLGSVYITGTTNGSLDGPFLGGGADVFVAKFSTGLSCDFDSNLTCNIADVNRLVGEIVAGTNDSALDVTADGAVNDVDLAEWLAEAATENGFAAPYLLGDANLDGTVNASDLNALGQNWLGHPNAWQLGDFNADGIVDAIDLNKIGMNWLTAIPSAASPQSVPESSAFTLQLFAIMATPRLRRRYRRP